MTIDPQQVRIEGVYAQRQPGMFMMRAKVPAGVLSAEQALKVADIAERFAGGRLHLTTRSSIEFHDVAGENLAEIGRMMAAVGLTSRGACGGAVRGVVAGPPLHANFPVVQVLARKLHDHFTRNPHFEGLPKKFKIGVFAGADEGYHLIQDLGLVYAGMEDGIPCYDVWTAGGLGREPQPAFLLEARVVEPRIIPLAEAIIHVYLAQGERGKRLKHVLRQSGEEKFRALLQQQLGAAASLPLADGFAKALTRPGAAMAKESCVAAIVAGELSVAGLRCLAEVAARCCGGFMVLTADQNVAFLPAEGERGAASALLGAAGFNRGSREERVSFRICPGSHECRMGLSPTRDVARAVVKAMGARGEDRSWSISGCPNSCSQPQLADIGIVTVKSIKDEAGERQPLFNLLRRDDAAGFGTPLRQGIGLAELLAAVAEL